jgi:predicted RNA-binding Zn-ribbon protein involved in translation (DUF1610 family)
MADEQRTSEQDAWCLKCGNLKTLRIDSCDHVEHPYVEQPSSKERLGPPDHLCPKCGAYVMCDNDAEIERLRAGLQLIATDEHRLMGITARQTAESILNGKPIHADETAAGLFECPMCGAKHETRKWEDVRKELDL